MCIYSRSVRRHFVVFYEPSYSSAIFRRNSTSLSSRMYDTTLRCITCNFCSSPGFWLAKVSRCLKVTDEIILKISSECTWIFLAEKKCFFLKVRLVKAEKNPKKSYTWTFEFMAVICLLHFKRNMHWMDRFIMNDLTAKFLYMYFSF